MAKNKINHFGKTRIIVLIILAILGMNYLSNHSMLGVLLILVALFIVFMDYFNKADEEKEEKPVHEPEYDPSELGDPVKCPFCGKKIPSGVNYCFYCGRPLEAFKRIEKIRVESLEQIDRSLTAIDEGTHWDNVKTIRKLTDKILREYEKKPEVHKGSDRFIDYYLPKTVSAIKHYGVLCTLDNLDREEAGIKKQLEDSLGTLSEAFSNILNKVSTEGLDDVSADVDVLENILKQEGLTDPDFKIS